MFLQKRALVVVFYPTTDVVGELCTLWNRWAKVVDTDIEDEGEQMIAFSMWYFWTSPKEQERQVWGPAKNAEACEEFLGGMRERRQERFKGKPFACKSDCSRF